MSNFLTTLRNKSQKEKKIIFIVSTLVMMSFAVIIWYSFSDFNSRNYTINFDSLKSFKEDNSDLLDGFRKNTKSLKESF
ncbi:hypothetical protein A2442_03385 [Candidatus Campbellbacteria bacterium RIFOXYC2_FULL_35_25]|uniref:Uncharacterized protein n=1 Tax=Candidatus Campbellbacteria bacterium RIFOXYC2_FULL_35_25 TaxID=1797582 RepID=A0A1F5EHK3_9BACT|nr:MAG: hypothetical protein A2442_03385 [Candidatus Campbellbacteria bacterium RIFOXYC2_FULL_35_25]